MEELYQKYSNLIYDICEYIYNHAELGNEEFESSQYLVDVLKNNGFTVEYPYLDISTSFRAEFKKGEGKKIAFLPEYDALPGYGKNKMEIKHACGHNWISATCLGAALLLKESEFDGTIVVIGTPAEETTGGKCELVNKGAFNDIDGAIQMHLGAENNIDVKTLAMDSYEFTFNGMASHAAAYPELGVNALDAVNLMFAGVNALRQHMKSDARVAGIITHGGEACNIVPDRCACKFYIRAKEKSYVKELTEKIINCAKGACLMTGCSVEYHPFENSYDNLVYDSVLKELLKKNLNVNFVLNDEEASGSSDIGNVSQVCPTVYCEIETGANPKVYAHNEDFLDFVHGNNALNTLKIATISMAKTALDYSKID